MDTHNNMEVMYVIKRDGSREDVSFDKVSNRFKKLIKGDPGMKSLKIDYISLSQKVCAEIYSGVKTHELDELAAQTCASLITDSSDYGILASRLAISNHHKKTSPSFSETVHLLYTNLNNLGESVPLVTKDFYTTVMKHKTKFNQIIDYSRDYLFDYFAFKTLEKSYLMKANGNIVERPQHLLLRVSIGIHGTDVKSAIECYNSLSMKKYIHATPTLFNAGTTNGQLASCFLMGINEDSIVGIYDSLKDTALISKNSGGIGIHIHDVRARGSMIGGGTGTSSGIVPMLRVFNNTAKYVDQCIIPETIIYTTDGPMEIQNVVAGETKIYNSSGQVETIGDVLEHPYEGIMYEIETSHSVHKLKITDEHPVLVVPNQKKGLNSDVIRNRLNKKLTNMEFKEVKNLTDDDMIVYSVPKYEQDYETITCDDCYFYGILLGDGHLENNKTYGYISLNTETKMNVLEFCKSYLQSYFIKYNMEETDSKNCVRIRWNKSVDLKFRYADVYNEKKEKYIHKKWLNLPINKAKYIVKGLMDTDGCYGVENRPQELCFDSTSKTLIEGFRFILLRLGVLTSGSIRDRVGESHTTNRGVIVNQKVSYVLRVPRTKEVTELLGLKEEGQFFKFLKYTDENGRDFLMTRIKSITSTSYSGTLYDLQMKDKHEYMIHQGIIHNGGGKRNGSFAIYLEPWHADIQDFLDLRKNTGFEEIRARDLFYALWIPDLFMRRVEEDSYWTLMCPNQCPGLADIYGEAFDKKYIEYEESGEGVRLSARELWFKILESQIETGTPYLLFKDACNKKSNQSNLGTIKSSNLCCEVVEYSGKDETAVCNLASLSLSSFVMKPDVPGKISITSIQNCLYCKLIKSWCDKWDLHYEYNVVEAEPDKKYPQISVKSNENDDVIFTGGYTNFTETFPVRYDYEELEEMTRQLTRNLNRVIDKTTYPIESARRSNTRHRPIGIGVQGLSDVFMKMRVAFDSSEARDVNDKIFETMYYAAVSESMKIAKKKFDKKKSSDNSKYPCAYSSFEGSPLEKGLFQFNLWNKEPTMDENGKTRYDWDTLRNDIKTYGVVNSLLISPMPTASSSTILGNNECFEPITSNIYVRRTLAGEFIVMNKYLQQDLQELNLWNKEMKDNILLNNGSIQQINGIPQCLKDCYKTVWEISQKVVIDMAADRGKYICQSQSMNLFIAEPQFDVLTSMFFYSWKSGLKTGCYYLRTRPQSKAQQFSIEVEQSACEACSA
tara:strand:+ start:481 stop:4182 length:3702 start_codon:yes stop_codon:yes gene_type:complete